VVEGFSKGKAAGGISKSDLIDSSAPDWGVICSVSIVNVLGVEEGVALAPALFFRTGDEGALPGRTKKLVRRIGEYRESPKLGSNNKATPTTMETSPARAASRGGE
jgi:hypothetical protein